MNKDPKICPLCTVNKKSDLCSACEYDTNALKTITELGDEVMRLKVRLNELTLDPDKFYHVEKLKARLTEMKNVIRPHESLEEYQKAWEELHDEAKAASNHHKKCWAKSVEREEQLQSQIDMAIEALKEMKHNNHHTIEEEKWRIDNLITHLERNSEEKK